jgi:hypothetical protein
VVRVFRSGGLRLDFYARHQRRGNIKRWQTAHKLPGLNELPGERRDYHGPGVAAVHPHMVRTTIIAAERETRMASMGNGALGI